MVDEGSLDSCPVSRRAAVVSGRPAPERQVCVDEAPDPETESRVFSYLWLRNSQIAVVAVEGTWLVGIG